MADAEYCRGTNAHKAGTAVFARDWLGLGWPPGRGPIHYDARLITAMVECATLRAMLAGSMYLKTGLGGATPYNLRLLYYAGHVVIMHMPWLLGGDFQTPLSEVEATLFPEAAGARIVADLSPVGICTSAYVASTLDYFVM